MNKNFFNSLLLYKIKKILYNNKAIEYVSVAQLDRATAF